MKMMLPQVVVMLLAINLPGRLSGSSPISVQEFVEIGGIRQWVSIKGTDDQNPVLLFLHGGPGNSAMGYADKFTSELQKHFIVVLWDQRESGKTAELNHSPGTLTVSLMEEDAVEMINYLRSRFSQNKIYLMGHSWGGFLGLRIASSHPQLLLACFAISPMVYQLESERLSLEWMRENADRQGNQEALRELSGIRIPFQNGEQLYYHRRWLAKGMGTKAPAKAFVMTWAKTWLALFNEASAVNFFLAAPELNCPVFFFVGSKDHQTYGRLTEQYFNVVKAEKKDLFWFTNSAHNLNLTEPKKLQDIVISLSLLR
jgi:pimeloyl-ACP methyl ester carboxylesterase